MTLRNRSLALACACGILTAAPAAAHFQLMFTPEANIVGGRVIEMIMAFAHPFSGDPMMDMGLPQAFYVIAQAGDGAAERTDLAEYLTPVTFHGNDSTAAAYVARIPGAVTRGLGDFSFVLEPAPYYEAEEDIYIQQLTKVVLNSGGVPGNWAEPLGLATEIVPLDKPYGLWAGGIFRGVVLSDGEPVPFAEIEVEYVNHAIDPALPGWTGEAAITAPHAVMETLSLRADASGTVMIALPRAGWWGIGALGVGPVTEHDGKPMSQDAVLWVHALPMPE